MARLEYFSFEVDRYFIYVFQLLNIFLMSHLHPTLPLMGTITRHIHQAMHHQMEKCIHSYHMKHSLITHQVNSQVLT